jgi:hypothetical protein
MNKDKKTAVIGIICFVLIWLCITMCGYRTNKKHIAYQKTYIEEIYGDIQFKGKVLQLHKIRRGGRTYGLMCVKIDSTNTESFYRFDDTYFVFGSKHEMSCLKIEDGIATFPTNFIGNEEGHKRDVAIFNARYIEVNINNSRQIVYIDSMGNRYEDGFHFGSNNLIEEDMNVCDGCY